MWRQRLVQFEAIKQRNGFLCIKLFAPNMTKPCSTFFINTKNNFELRRSYIVEVPTWHILRASWLNAAQTKCQISFAFNKAINCDIHINILKSFLNNLNEYRNTIVAVNAFTGDSAHRERKTVRDLQLSDEIVLHFQEGQRLYAIITNDEPNTASSVATTKHETTRNVRRRRITWKKMLSLFAWSR